MRHFDQVLAHEWKKVPSAAVCAFAWHRRVLMSLMSFRWGVIHKCKYVNLVVKGM
jgi:hypothetical protein